MALRPQAGVLRNLQLGPVSLPEKIRLKHLRKLETFLGATAVTRQDAVSLRASLQHDAGFYHAGRSYLYCLASFISDFPNDRVLHRRVVPKHTRLALDWWKGELSLPPSKRSPQLPRRKVDPDIWADAATSWGLGFVIGSQWAAWRLLPGWHREGRDIMWAELIALELATLWIKSAGFRDADVVIHSDNVGAIDIVNKGKSRNLPREASIRRIVEYLIPQNLTITPIYVSSRSNLADPISRGKLGGPGSRLHCGFELPSELLPFLCPVN